MLSGNALHTIKACRFCWMCRHLCPVGLVTGKESNTPRAKALLLDMEQKGTTEMKVYAEDMFQCALCASCATNCETGYEPPVFIREARRNIVANGLAPDYVMDVIEKLMTAEAETQNPASETADVLVYIGAHGTAAAKEMAEAFGSVLTKAGVTYKTLTAEPADGNELYDLIGETAEVKAVAKKCADAINAAGVKKVVVLNPSAARMFLQEYPAWGLELSCEVETATSFAANLLKEGKLKMKQAAGMVTFHDPCRLARDLEETEPARELIRAMGYELKEMIQSKKLTKCCGGLVLNAHSPKLAQLTASGRISDADRIDVPVMFTACPGCRSVLQNGDGKAEVKDLFVVLNENTL